MEIAGENGRYQQVSVRLASLTNRGHGLREYRAIFSQPVGILFRAIGGPQDMLGDQIGEETGKVTGFRVLDPAGPTAEVSITTKGKILGSEYQGRATYTSKIQPGGFLFGEGQGVYMTGDGMAVWKGQGTGRLNPGGGASYRGAIHFLTATGKLAKLAGMVGVFEHSTDANDNASSKLWEWK